MTYNTILTSKGTTTIPIEIRKQLGIKPGMIISFSKDPKTREYVLRRARTIKEIREANKLALRRSKTSTKQYTSGIGYGRHVIDKFGSK